MNEKDTGIARSRSKEKNNQQDAGARGKGTAIKRLGPLATPRHNGTSKGKISRPSVG